jgi:hypothetical protein
MRLQLPVIIAATIASVITAAPLALVNQVPIKAPNHPYTPKHRDPYDKKIDSYGEELQPLPWRNGDGATILGPQNRERQRQNPDMMRPPSTDHGDMKNMRWSFADSHVRIEEGGWTRQTTNRELATSIELAGVNMRLDEGAIRELHWHTTAEWAYVLEGNVRITALDTEGGNFIDDLEKGERKWREVEKAVTNMIDINR